MRIGIIGTGRIGATLGRLWAEAGHSIVYGSRHPETLGSLVAGTGPNASATTIEEAAGLGEVLLISLPLVAVPEVARRLAGRVDGKVVLETSNPYPERDGDLARQVIEGGRGMGVFARTQFPAARIVRAFNSVWDRTLAEGAHRPDPKIGIPLAADDDDALRVAASLVRDAGFGPVAVGGLDGAVRFDVGTPVYNTGWSDREVADALGARRSATQSASPNSGGTR